jgi:hypothetical protein
MGSKWDFTPEHHEAELLANAERASELSAEKVATMPVQSQVDRIIDGSRKRGRLEENSEVEQALTMNGWTVRRYKPLPDGSEAPLYGEVLADQSWTVGHDFVRQSDRKLSGDEITTLAEQMRMLEG